MASNNFDSYIEVVKRTPFGKTTRKDRQIFELFEDGKKEEALAAYTAMVKEQQAEDERQRVKKQCEDHVAFWTLFGKFSENPEDFCSQKLDEGLMGFLMKARFCDGRYTDVRLNLESITSPNPLQKLFQLGDLFADTIPQAKGLCEKLIFLHDSCVPDRFQLEYAFSLTN